VLWWNEISPPFSSNENLDSSPDQLLQTRHSELLEVVSPNGTDALKNSVAKSLETITEQPTYLEIDLFSADKSNAKYSIEKKLSQVSS